MAFRGAITYVGVAGVTRAALRRTVRVQLKNQAEEWHSETLKRHFSRGARQRYRYTPRTARYNRRKQRVRGHTKPLVDSGRLKRELLRLARITSSTKRGSVSMNAPRYLRQYVGRSRINKADEIIAVSQGEVREMARSVNRGITQQINNDRTSQDRRV